MFCTWHFYMKLVWYVPRLISIPHQGWHQSIKIRTVVAFIDSYWGPLHENVGDEQIRTGFSKVWSQNFALKTLHLKSFRIWLIINCICMFTSISILIMTELACVKSKIIYQDVVFISKHNQYIRVKFIYWEFTSTKRILDTIRFRQPTFNYSQWNWD